MKKKTIKQSNIQEIFNEADDHVVGNSSPNMAILQINIKKTSDRMIGYLRLPSRVFDKIESIAKREKVSKQTIVRAILDLVIDQVN